MTKRARPQFGIKVTEIVGVLDHNACAVIARWLYQTNQEKPLLKAEELESSLPRKLSKRS